MHIKFRLHDKLCGWKKKKDLSLDLEWLEKKEYFASQQFKILFRV